jgi:hypothetical protein
MRIFAQAATAAGFLALAACNNTPAEKAADNVEDAAEHQSDILEDQADNTANEVVSDALENQADAIEEQGDNQADAIRDADDHKVVKVNNSLVNGM